jgi:short-subunit dehydrogenase
MSQKPTVLITGASSGIGAVYADRFGRRGHDLVLVARDGARLEQLGDRLRREAGVQVDVLWADVTNERDITAVETRLREDARIGVLVNNAGATLPGQFLDQGSQDVAGLIALNVTALTRLTAAVAPRMAAAGGGSIINLGSVVGLAGNRHDGLWGDQGLCALPDAGSEPRTRVEGRLRPGRASRGHAHGNLEAIRS